jgi:propionyl-CoA synthetase
MNISLTASMKSVATAPVRKYIRYPEFNSAADGFSSGKGDSFEEEDSHKSKDSEFVNEHYDKLKKMSEEDKEGYWDMLASHEEVFWHKKYTKVLDDSKKPLYRWFPDGEINICYNAIDKHVERGFGNNVAMIYDSAYLNITDKFTYKELLDRVGRIASFLKKKFGVTKGDRVLLYMPMVPVSTFFMLACARIGAIHSVVFGGFAAKELANRIDDCKPKVIITASCGLEPGKVIKYRPIVDEALDLAHTIQDARKSIKRVIVQRKD